MNRIGNIVKKEFTRFFKDRRMVLTTLLLPGLLIYVVYSLMGSVISDKIGGDEKYVPTVYTVRASEKLSSSIFDPLAAAGAIEKEEIGADRVEEIKDKIAAKEADILLVFPEDFDSAMNGETAPNIEIYYNSVREQSSAIYGQILGLLNEYETQQSNLFDVNRGGEGNLASEKEVTGSFLSMLFPFLILVFLFSGCIAVAPEAIAGEKERGTIATLLVTPMKRSELALGKIISLSVIATLSAICSFIGIILSLPKMAAGMPEMDVSAYGFGDYAMLLLVIVTTVLVLISLVSVVSAFAKSVKEANAYVTPIMLVIVLLGVTSMLSGGGKTAVWAYCIPIFNSIKAMSSVFAFQSSVGMVLLASGINLAVSALLVWLLARMFQSEKVMFSR